MSFDRIVSRASGARGAIFQGDAASTREPFDMIVFCAEEFQPPRPIVPKGAEIVYAGIDDAALTPGEIRTATRAAREVAAAFLQDRQVLVSCMGGTKPLGARDGAGLVDDLRDLRSGRRGDREGAPQGCERAHERQLRGVFEDDPRTVHDRGDGVPKTAKTRRVS